MLAIKDLNNITRRENRFLQYKPVYLCIYDACYDDIMMMQSPLWGLNPRPQG